MNLDEIFEYTNIDPWFLNQLAQLHQAEQWIRGKALTDISRDDFVQVKKRGFSDLQLATLTGRDTLDSRVTADIGLTIDSLVLLLFHA